MAESEDGPGFTFLHKSTPTPESITTTITAQSAIDDVITTVQNVVQSILNNQTQSTVLPAIPEETTVFSVSSTINTIVLNNQTQSTILPAIPEETTVFSLSSTINTIVKTNNTITESVSEIAETIPTITTVSTFIDDTTTESVLNTISDNLTTAASITSTNDTNDYDGNLAEIEDKTLYIVLGVILVALFLILIILVIIYRRYKSRSGLVTRVYCVTDLNEVRVSNSNLDSAKEQRITFN